MRSRRSHEKGDEAHVLEREICYVWGRQGTCGRGLGNDRNDAYPFSAEQDMQ